MSLTSKEAAETLSDVERASRRSAQAFGYSKASPHLILWGLIWLIGYAVTDLFPDKANWIWSALVLAGCIGGFLLGRGAARDGASASGSAAARRNAARAGWRSFGLMGIVCAFIASTYAVMWPVQGMQFAAFPALLVGAIYAAVGLWSGPRYVVTGLLILALTIGGYFFLHEHFLLWMAGVGGGGLILAGIWFRTA